MILATHAIAGATVGVFFRHYPFAAIAAGILSHYATDSIPHWEYKLRSYRANPAKPYEDSMSFDTSFLIDLALTATDAILGLVVSLLLVGFDSPYLWVAFLGAMGGMLPDFLQLVYHVFPNSFMRHHQWFHHLCHAKTRLNDRPLIGIPLQILIALIFILIILAKTTPLQKF